MVGDVPLKENWEPAVSGKRFPPEHGEPNWDGSWFVFQNTDGTTVPATLNYKGPAVINNRSHVIYTIERNLTRTVHKIRSPLHQFSPPLLIWRNGASLLSIIEKPDNIRDTTSGGTQQFIPAILLFRHCRYTMRKRMELL
ncbi:MAG: hypothetical protein MJ014_03100 [Methanocorpusculum sp.]|nr:hypothetical protein [Methanocorpusculum sp.]